MNHTRNSSTLISALAVAGLLALGSTVAHAEDTIDGISFANETGTLYAPVRPLAKELGIPVHWDAQSGAVFLGDTKIPDDAQRSLFGGQQLIAVRELSQLINGTSVRWDAEAMSATISLNEHITKVQIGEKKVVVNRDAQRMRAYQGNLLVLDTPVSTGRPGHITPTGSYTAGPLKARMLISHTYNDAKMPYSVQIRGDYVIHGYSSVPNYPASHGCVRVPLTNGNPAKWFYQWVNVGTPVVIADTWQPAPKKEATDPVSAG